MSSITRARSLLSNLAFFVFIVLGKAEGRYISSMGRDFFSQFDCMSPCLFANRFQRNARNG